MEANTERIDSFIALALQLTCHGVNHVQTRSQARSLMAEAIKRLDAQIAASRAFIGNDCRLVLLPEYWLTGFPLEGVFPVAKTAIGNLAAIASDEILFPEIARCLTMRGAEILLHPTSEVHGDARSP